jgi:hypothetical protein
MILMVVFSIKMEQVEYDYSQSNYFNNKRRIQIMNNTIVNVKEAFIELLRGNKINGHIETNPYKLMHLNFSIGISFNEITVSDDGTVSFWDDVSEDRAETAGVFSFDLGKLEKVVYKTDVLNLDELYGKYDAVLCFTDMEQVLISFNMNDENEVPEGSDTARLKGLSLEERIKMDKNNKNKAIDVILSHVGTFLININPGDFVESAGLEVYNMAFSHVKSIRQNELLSWDNSNMQPIRFTEENVPVYPMEFSSNFYIEVKKIVSIDEIDAIEYRDIFEYSTDKIFNLNMNDGSIISIGLMD